MKYRGPGVLRFEVDVFRHTIHFLYLLTEKEIDSYAKKHFLEEWKLRPGIDFETGHFVVPGYAGASAIMIGQKLIPGAGFDHEVLAHEIQHVVSNICKECSMPRTVIDDEPWAYLTGFITRKIYEWLLGQ